MQLAKIIGTATATVKHPSLAGGRLLVVQPLLADRQGSDGDPQLAIDTVAAGVGDTVVISSDGRLLRELLKSDTTPARWSTIALLDDPAGARRQPLEARERHHLSLHRDVLPDRDTARIRRGRAHRWRRGLNHDPGDDFGDEPADDLGVGVHRTPPFRIGDGSSSRAIVLQRANSSPTGA